MNDFITGLQFLTRIKIKDEREWSAESFGRSVKYFSFVGASIGIILWACGAALLFIEKTFGVAGLPPALQSLLLLALAVFLSGGLTCDGFMDSMDGLFSGRERERMLEIMKDSCVGANGVTAFVFLILTKWATLQAMSGQQFLTALWAMPIGGKMAMASAITLFPYARPDGIGKAFAVYAGKKTFWLAIFSGMALLAAGGVKTVLAAVMAILLSMLFARWAVGKIGGLTGDLYGACSEIAEVSLLLAMLVLG